MNKQDLKLNIKTRLEALTGWTAYDYEAETAGEFPYIIYKVGHGDSDKRGCITRNLELEFWIDDIDTALLDAKSDIVRKGKYSGDTLLEPGFDRSYSDEGEDVGFYNSFHDWEDKIDTGESDLNRFDQRYVLHVYG